MAIAEERPWLWLIYFVAVGFPIALITSFCWPRRVKVKKMNFLQLKKQSLSV